MGIEKLYRKLRNKSNRRSLVDIGKEIFQDDVKRELEKYVKTLDSDYPEVTAVWSDIDEDQFTSMRMIKSDYSIDIEMNGILIIGMGYANIHNDGSLGCTLKFYRGSERGTQNHYLDTINASGYGADKFINKLVNEVKGVIDKALEEEDE